MLFEATRVECGVKMDVSTPESSRAALTQRLIVSLDTLLCGFSKLIRNEEQFYLSSFDVRYHTQPPIRRVGSKYKFVHVVLWL